MITSQGWHIEQILGLAAYTLTAVDAQRYAHRDHWQSLGRHGAYIWGTFKGSRELRVAIDLSSVQMTSGAMVCECRGQMPCHHSLALLLLMMLEETAFAEGTVPGFVRDNVFPKHITTKASGEIRDDIQRGLTQLDQWLTVLIRQGLAEPHVRDLPYWNEIADRMLAAWMPGLSQWLRDVGRIAARSSDWVEPVLEELGRMYLLVRSFDRFDQLPAEIQADIRDAIGWRLPPENLATAVHDRWFVLGQRQRPARNRIPEQLTWLYGLESKRMALLHSLGADEVLQTIPFTVGQVIEAEVAYLPARVPLKVQLVSHHGMMPREAIQGVSIGEAVEGFGQALARNPWLRHYPILLDKVYISRFGKGWTLRHEDGTYLPIAPYFQHKWVLHAAHSGYPIQVAAIWDGRSAFPISAINATEIVNLNQIIRYTKR